MTEELTDRELADLVTQRGDEDAFRALYRRHTPGVYQFVLRLVGGNVQEAEDVIQETWMRAARGLEGFRWQSALRSWLTGIALNRVREMARKRKRSLVEVEGEPLHHDATGREVPLQQLVELPRVQAAVPRHLR